MCNKCELVEDSLDRFLMSYFSTQVNRYDGFLVYHHIPFGYYDTTVKEMEDLIRILDLPLKVTPNKSKGLFQDSITVEAKYGKK